ncbi:MAG: DUF4445 domain-containing protein [Clostridia bacterium]|nr:DUF4445 domain-containing protein [Clostridia bacterium]
MKITIHAKGKTILETAREIGITIEAACGGRGKCGKCKIKLLNGQCSPLHQDERLLLTEEEIAEGYRLACRATPLSDAEIAIPEKQRGSDRKKGMASLPDGFIPSPAVKKVYCKLPKPTFEDQRSDCTRVKEALAAVPHHALLRGLSSAVRSKKGFTAAISNGQIIAIEEGDTTSSCYGLAIDIGTTTAVTMLWDLNTYECLGTAARTNPQSLYGGDVISRIQHGARSETGLSELQVCIIGCVNDMIEELAQKHCIAPLHIYDITIVGNTTMGHLFLGIDPKPLARSPFAPVFVEGQSRRAYELEINANPLAKAYFLPHMAGHVGADITGVLLSTGIKEKQGAYLAIDIGTNGEILLSHNGRVLTCSTAAGPAFEGACIYRGMRAAEGAIERVSIQDDDISVCTIGNKPAIGICGSGLIDAVAALVRLGVIDSSGKMLSRAESAHLPTGIAQRITEHEGKPAFTLSGEVILTQQDIREVQLAKGAIRAGAETLMQSIGLTAHDLDGVLLAGAFGSYIDKHSALGIGLLPDVPQERITSVGNAAGAGASMALLSTAARQNAEVLAAEVEHIELSANPEFQEAYIKAMGF